MNFFDMKSELLRAAHKNPDNFQAVFDFYRHLSGDSVEEMEELVEWVREGVFVTRSLVRLQQTIREESEPKLPEPAPPTPKPHFMMLHWLGIQGEDYILVPLKTMVLGAGMTPGGLAVFGVTDLPQETGVFRKIHIYGNGESVEGGFYVTSVEVNGVWCHLFDSSPWELPMRSITEHFNCIGEQIK